MTALTITAVWDGKTFSPDLVFLEDCQALRKGGQVTLVINDDAHPSHLRWYWWCIGLIIKSGQWNGDKDSLDDYTRQGTGFGKWRALSDGREIFVPNSIALSKCGGTKFKKFMFAAEHLWAERLGVDIDHLVEQAVADTGISRVSLGMEEHQEPPLNDLEQLRALGYELSYADDAQELDSMWEEAKAAEGVKGLHSRHPEAVEAIVALAKAKTEGKITGKEFDRLVREQKLEPDKSSEPPLDERLRAIGFELAFAKSENELDTMWAAAKTRDNVKALYKEQPEVLRTMLATARKKVTGKLSEEECDRIIRASAVVS